MSPEPKIVHDVETDQAAPAELPRARPPSAPGHGAEAPSDLGLAPSEYGVEVPLGPPAPTTAPDQEREPDNGDRSDAPTTGRDLAFVVAFWSGLVLIFMLTGDKRRAWLLDNWVTLTVGLALVATIVAVLYATGWAKSRGPSTRAAVLLMVGYPLLVLTLASVFFVLPPEQQLVAMRGVVLVTLSITPALLWWLFLATQRASLLNEFVANLQRLGLLDAWCVGGRVESDRSRAIRISGYLQRFEATYGRMPQAIHDNVINNSAEPYSKEDARESVPLATAAVPVFLSIVVFSIGWLLTLPPIESFPTSDVTPRWLLALSPNTTPVTMTFLGAYFFSLQMLFRRYVRADLRGSAYVAVVLRVVLALIGIWVIEATGSMAGWQTRSELLLFAFIIGVFPVVVWQVVRSLGSSLFQVFVPTLKTRLPLSELDGLTVWHESRLEEEDIENVPNMATADVVDLLVNTRFPAGRVVDWVDQAILLTQLGAREGVRHNGTSSRDILARHGIRTASACLMAAHDAREADQFDDFADILVDDRGKPTVTTLLAALRTNSNLAHILRWRGLESI